MMDQFEGYSTDSEENQHTDQDAILVFEGVWNSFYDWEPAYCRRTLSHLASPSATRSPPQYIKSETLVAALDLSNARRISDSVDFYQYPKYEFCTPINKTRTIRANDIQNDGQSMLAFIPYADSAKFPIVQYMFQFRELAWQSQDYGCKDPDGENINLDVMKRLIAQGFDHAQIDKLVGPCRTNNESGLIWDNSQRDPLIWPGSWIMVAPPSFLPSGDLLESVDLANKRFCGELTCIESNCSYHRSNHASFDGLKLQNFNKSMMKGSTCSPYCFRRMKIDELIKWDIFWDSSDVDVLVNVLSIMPNALPCHLAIICHKQCWEVLIHYFKVTPDNTTNDDEIPQQEPRRRLKFVDNDIESFQWSTPCYHKGSCSLDSNCSCVQNGLHCQRSCRCGIKCHRQRRGCSCHESKSCTRKGNKCSCYRAQRECNPELCRCCAGSRKTCTNIAIQKGLFPRIEVKKADFGLGAFATQNYKMGDFVGVYVGLAHDSICGDSLQVKNNFIDLNYIFTLTANTIIDAGEIGNETRYLNHQESPDNNCKASYYLVNGNKYIGLFATKGIMKGQELLLDYGGSYWIDQ